MFSALASSDGRRCWFGVMHLGGDVLAFPCGKNSWKQVDNIPRALSNFVGIENDIVMMKIKHHGDVELFTNGQKFMYRPADIVIF